VLNLDSFRAGDHDAFKQVFYANTDLLRRYLSANWKRIPSDVKEDIISEVFYKLYTHRDRIRDEKHIIQYLLVSLKHAIYDLYDKNKKPFVDIEVLPQTAYFQEETIDKTDYRKLLRDAVNKLPKQRRQTILLLFYENKSMREVCEILGISYQTVMNHRNIAIHTLGQLKEAVVSSNRHLVLPGQKRNYAK